MVNFIQSLDAPFTLVLILLGWGIFRLWKKDHSIKTKLLLSSGFILLLIGSNRFTVTSLLNKFENQFSPIISKSDFKDPSADIHYIVVLGGLSHQNAHWPITSQLGSTMLVRLNEGIRLFRQIPQSRLILSGGGRQTLSDARIMEDLAIQLGVDPSKIILEEKSTNTYEEALYLKNLLQRQRFLLVTSARHMPRAIVLFRKMGLEPIAAPTDFFGSNQSLTGFRSILPRSGTFNLFSELFYEYLGFIKAKWNHQI